MVKLVDLAKALNFRELRSMKEACQVEADSLTLKNGVVISEGVLLLYYKARVDRKRQTFYFIPTSSASSSDGSVETRILPPTPNEALQIVKDIENGRNIPVSDKYEYLILWRVCIWFCHHEHSRCGALQVR